VKKFLLPLGAGVVVFGAATAFAATLTVNTNSLGAGNATVDSCNSSATVTYDTAATSGGSYQVTTAPVTTAATCNGKSFKVTLLGDNSASLAEVTGTLDSSGAASPDFSSSSIAAHDVVGVAVVITG
jgi:hypothetical protein